MTLRNLVACASPLADGNTVRDHLAAIDCINLGGVAGVAGDITYTGEIYEVVELASSEIEDIVQFIEIIERADSGIEEIGIISNIIELTEDNIDGLC